MTITFMNNADLKRQDLESLYSDVQWTAYTRDMDLLMKAVQHSLATVSAWDGGRLVGLVRVVGDGLTIIYIQDILVLNAYQNKGIATALMQAVLEKYPHVRQKILLTEEAPDVRHFYEKNGFESCDKGNVVAFAKFD